MMMRASEPPIKARRSRGLNVLTGCGAAAPSVAIVVTGLSLVGTRGLTPHRQNPRRCGGKDRGAKGPRPVRRLTLLLPGNASPFCREFAVCSAGKVLIFRMLERVFEPRQPA